MNGAQDDLTPAGDGAGPAGAVPGWEVIHSGTADSASTHAARALMRTSDGEFRITALQVDGKVGLTIEVLKPPADAEPDELTGTGEVQAAKPEKNNEAGKTDKADESDPVEAFDGFPAFARGPRGPAAVPHPRRGGREGGDGPGGRAEAA